MNRKTIQIIFGTVFLLNLLCSIPGTIYAETAPASQARSSYWASGGKNLVSRDAEISLIERDELLALMHQSEKVIFVDTRTPAEFEVSHLPKAINIPFSEIEKNAHILQQYAEATVVPYCNWDFRAYVGALNMKKLGISNIKMMYPHGLKGWLASGLPLAGKEPARSDKEAQSILNQFVLQSNPATQSSKSSNEIFTESGNTIRLSLRILPKTIEPEHIKASLGDRVILEIEAVDEDHWFVMPDFRINLELQKGEKKTVELLMTRKGYFPYGCISCCLRYQCRTKQAILVDLAEDLTKYGE